MYLTCYIYKIEKRMELLEEMTTYFILLNITKFVYKIYIPFQWRDLFPVGSKFYSFFERNKTARYETMALHYKTFLRR